LGHAFHRASVSETLGFLGLQELDTDRAPVLTGLLAPLEVGLLVSHGELLEVLGGLSSLSLNLSVKLSFSPFIPGVVQWFASRFIRAFTQSAVLPFWRSGQWVEGHWSGGQASLENLFLTSYFFDEHSVQDLGKGPDGRHQDASFVGDQLGLIFREHGSSFHADSLGSFLEGWITDELLKLLLLDLHRFLDKLIVGVDDEFLRLGGSADQSDVGDVLHLSCKYLS
jgi:hypothetical protein